MRISGSIPEIGWVRAMGNKITENRSVDTKTGEVEHEWLMVGGHLPFKIEVSNPSPTLVIECSLPKRRWGSNLRPLTAVGANMVVRDLYRYFGQYTRWLCPVQDLRVRRLDACVNFVDVTSLDVLLRGLGAVTAPGERRNPAVFYDRDHGGALTLARGSRNYERSLLYDKYTEVTHRHRAAASTGTPPPPTWEVTAAKNIVRFETQARNTYLANNHVHTVADVTQSKLDELARKAWDRHGFGTHVAGIPQAIHRLEESDLSPSRQAGVLRHLMHERLGLPCGASINTCQAHRKQIHQLGLAPSGLDTHIETWLDFDTRRQMSRAEAN